VAEFFCQKCLIVSHQVANNCCECGKNMEEFDPCKHGRSLISSANAWAQINGKWNDHPIFREASNILNADGCNGAAAHVNAFIRALCDKVEELCDKLEESNRCGGVHNTSFGQLSVYQISGDLRNGVVALCRDGSIWALQGSSWGRLK
jgi:hypothetical protein